MNDLIYIIVLNYNNWQDTIECLESICRLEYGNYRVIVVDNASINDSIPNINKWIAEGKNSNKSLDEVILIENRINTGYAGGNNMGIKYAIEKNDFQYIWIVNNDTVVDKLALKCLVEKTALDQQIGICGSRINYYNDKKNIQSVGSKVNYYFGNVVNVTDPDETDSIDGVMGASLFITKKCIETVGLLPEEYYLFFEESDYCLNAIKHGFNVTVALDSIVYHKVGGSTGGNTDYRKRSERADLLAFRSRIIFGRKYLKYKG